MDRINILFGTGKQGLVKYAPLAVILVALLSIIISPIFAKTADLAFIFYTILLFLIAISVPFVRFFDNRASKMVGYIILGISSFWIVGAAYSELNIFGQFLPVLIFALAKLLQIGWDKRKGEKHIVILTKGPPVSGKNDILEDIYAQEMALKYIQRLIKNRVKVLYIPFFADGARVGAYSAQSFANQMQYMGLTASKVTDEGMLMDAMYNGVKNMLRGQG